MKVINKMICELSKFTYSELVVIASDAGVNINTILNWINGKTKKPRTDTFSKVAVQIGYELTLHKSKSKAKLKLVK